MDSLGHLRWERLYLSHADHLFAYASRRVGPEEASDIVAETFLVAWRRIDDLPDDALPWLYAAARNMINNSRRAEIRRDALQRRLASVGATEASDDPAPEVETRADILAAMRSLPATEREALMLIAWEDLDPRRAAAVMGCSRGYLRRSIASRAASLDQDPFVRSDRAGSLIRVDLRQGRGR
jgi:RNA polymerase sigma-70 factor, ECF subfamily